MYIKGETQFLNVFSSSFIPFIDKPHKAYLGNNKHMVMKSATAALVIITMLVTVECLGNNPVLAGQERQVGGMTKMEMKYLACVIGCNVACPATCFYTDAPHPEKMSMMLQCIEKCYEDHKM